LLLWAVGVTPFKDNAWTTSNQPGCPPYKSGCQDPNVVLGTLVSVLSTGPVGFSDAIGHTDATLVMSTCNADGLLLKPDKPATPIDSTLVQFGSGQPEFIQLWDTFSDFSGTRWHYILAANISQSYQVHPSDIGLEGSNYVLDFFGSFSVSPFDNAHPLVVPAAVSTNPTVPIPFNYYIIAPVLSNGWSALGEVAKFVPMSKQRVSSISVAQTSLSVVLSGASGEQLTFAAVSPQGSIIQTPCTLSSAGTATVFCQISSCSCR